MFDSITVQTASESASMQTLIYTILLSFILSVILAIVYQKTFRGAFYSRNYVQSIVLISIIGAVVIQVVGDSLARGLGMMAAMAIVQFRNNLKDPRDLLFLFASLAAGISCGTYAFGIAVIGTIGFSLAVLVLYYSPLGLKNDFDGVLRFDLAMKNNEKQYLEKFMNSYCQSYTLMNLKDQDDEGRLSYAFHIRLKNDKSYEEFMNQLKRLPSIQGINLKMLGAYK